MHHTKKTRATATHGAARAKASHWQNPQWVRDGKAGAWCGLTVALFAGLAPSFVAANRALEPTFRVDGEPREAHIAEGSPREVVVGQDWAISVSHGTFTPLVLSTSGHYTVVVESYQAPLTLWLSEQDRPLAMSDTVTQDGQFQYRLTYDLVADHRYQVGVGVEGQVTGDVRYRIAVYSSSTRSMPLDPKCRLDPLLEGKTASLAFVDGGCPFLQQVARYFKLPRPEGDKTWLRIDVKAGGFIPGVEIYDPAKNGRTGEGWLDRRRRQAQYTGQLKGTEADLIVWANRTDLTTHPASLGDFALTARFYRLDPSRGFMAKSRDFLSDPLVSLAVGVLLGGILTYLFYRRGVARRAILYSLVADRTILRADETKESRLQVMRGSEAVSDHVGVCSAQVRFRGLRDLSEGDLVKPIRLEIVGASSILRATASANHGWQSVSIPPDAPTSIELSPKHLRSGDILQLDVFYTKKDSAKVSLKPDGEINDGNIRPDSDGLGVWAGMALLAASLFLAAAILVVVVDMWKPVPLVLFRPANAVFEKGIPVMFPLYWVFVLASNKRTRSWFSRRARRLRKGADAQELRFEAEPRG